MVKRIKHDATPDELRKTLADLDEEIKILNDRLARTPDSIGIVIENTFISQRGGLLEMKSDLVQRRFDIQRQLDRLLKEEQ